MKARELPAQMSHYRKEILKDIKVYSSIKYHFIYILLCKNLKISTLIGENNYSLLTFCQKSDVFQKTLSFGTLPKRVLTSIH